MKVVPPNQGKHKSGHDHQLYHHCNIPLRLLNWRVKIICAKINKAIITGTILTSIYSIEFFNQYMKAQSGSCNTMPYDVSLHATIELQKLQVTKTTKTLDGKKA
jgi:hypothetical protein